MGSNDLRCPSRLRQPFSRSPNPPRQPQALLGSTGVAVGGGSDGNFTAALGVPTLDGLGAIGGGAHADHEFVLVDTMIDRARLVAAIVAQLIA